MFFTREDILKIQQALLQLGVKDSELPSAEPVTYDDTLSIVQDGENKQIGVKDFFNQISLWKREDFINITDKYDEHYISLREAINLVPILQRKDGLVITFQDVEGNWEIYQFRGNITEFLEENKWFDLYDYRNYIVQSVVPDEEDLTASTPDKNGNSLIYLKDRIYDPTSFSGKGYKILRKNIQTINGSIKNILTQDAINQSNTIYEIRYDFDLNKATINLPQNCILKFCGGSLNNGKLIGDNSIIEAYPIKIFGKDLDVLGTFSNIMNYAEWFDLDYEKTLLTFYGIDFIGNYLISKKINIDTGTHRIYLKFHPQSKITVDSTFIGDYLFDIKNSNLADSATRSDYNTVSGQGEIDLSERCGLISFTASNKINNLVAKGTEFFNLSNVYHAGKSIDSTNPTYNSDTVVNTAIIKVSSESKFTNIELHASRNNSVNKPDCGILLQGSDHKLNRVTIVISTIGIYGIQGNTFIQDCHIWGAPQIAFYITGSHTINNTYGDWAICSFYFKYDWITANITNHFIIGSNNENTPWYEGKNMSIIKAKNPNNLSGQVSYFQGNAAKAKLCANDNNEEVKSNIRFQYIPNANNDFKSLILTNFFTNPDYNKNEFYIAIESNKLYASNLTIDIINDSSIWRKFIYSRYLGYDDYYCLMEISRNLYRSSGKFNIEAHINKTRTKIIIKIKLKYTTIGISCIPNLVKSYNITEDEYNSYINNVDDFTNLACVPLGSDIINLPEIQQSVIMPCFINNVNTFCSVKYPDKKLISVIPKLNSNISNDTFDNGFVAQKDGKIIIWNGTNWINVDGYSNDYLRKGTTINRPSLKAEDEGFEYYDTTLKKKILWNGTAWVNLDGTQIS